MGNPIMNRAQDHVVSTAKISDGSQDLDEEVNEETVSESDIDVDEESKKGRFGWMEVDDQFLPYIFRQALDKTKKYCTVSMVEKLLLNRLMDVLPNEVISCTNILGYPTTEAEKTILNHLIREHCEYSQFESDVMTVVNLHDAIDYYRFLKFCHQKIISTNCDSEDRCGFLKVNGEGVIPYIILNQNKFLPLFYFEEGEEASKLESVDISDWDLTYLKFCCKVQGIQRQLFDKSTCQVVNLQQIKSQFDEETTFEECWPEDGRIEAKSELKSPCKQKTREIISWQQDDVSTKLPTTSANDHTIPATANYPPNLMPSNYPNRPPLANYPNHPSSQPLNYPNRPATPPYPNRPTTPRMNYPNRGANFPNGFPINFPTNNPSHVNPLNLRMNPPANRPTNLPPNFGRNLPSPMYQQQQFLASQWPQNRHPNFSPQPPRQMMTTQTRNQNPNNLKRIRMTMG